MLSVDGGTISPLRKLRQPHSDGRPLAGIKMSMGWFEALQEKIGNCWEWHSPALPIRFRSAKPKKGDDYWEIWAYPALQEVVGGKEDGETVWSGFTFDVLQFLTDFEPEAVVVSTPQTADSYEMIFEGKFRGQGVLLHLGLEPPEDATATEIVDLGSEGGPVVRDNP